MGTTASIGGYEGGRSGQPMESIKKKYLADLLLHEWSSALDITNELQRLREAVDEYSLNQMWFSAHATVHGTLTMITAPEIRRVSRMIFDNSTPTSLQMIVMHSIYFRKFCGLLLKVLIYLVHIFFSGVQFFRVQFF